MGWIVVLIAIAVGGLLVWQNLQVVTLVFFGGIMTVKLPLAVWVLLFTLTGIISGLTLQFLYSFGRPLAAPKASSRIPANPAVPPPSPRPTYIQDRPASPPRSDWERDNGDDWNFDASPEAATTIQDREEFSGNISDGKKADVVKPDSDTSQTGSVYSYSYRTEKQTRGEKVDQVYDVNYRIITPPAQDQKEDRDVNKEDEEDWI
jgi:uncharacterized integral membrane protein